MNSDKRGYSIDLTFEEIKLPPFQDILVVAKNSPHGKLGISKTFELLSPDGFEITESNHPLVELIFINKKILKKVPVQSILDLLTENIFPYLSEGELIKVDIRVKVFQNALQL